MLDALSAPPVPAPGTVVTQTGSGARADQAQDGSFSKVLSNSGNQEKSARQGDQEQAAKTDDGDAGKPAVDVRSKRPVIDISENPAATSDGPLIDLADLSTDELARLLAAARSKTKEPGAENEKVKDGTSHAGTMSKAELAKALAGLRDNKAAMNGEPAASGTAEEEASASTKEADLSDVLRLLAGAPQLDTKADKTGDGEDASKAPIEQKAHVMLAEAVAAAAGAAPDDASTSQGQGGEPDRTFRVVKADGKAQPMILQGERAGRGEDMGDAAPVETIAVLDARRFIAPASTNNAASITAAMLGDGEWVSAMSPGSELANAASQSGHGKVVNTLKLQMSPIELGSVTATLRLSGEELSVQLTVDNPAALRQLQNDTSDILKGLRAQGLTVDHVHVNMQVASADRSADAGQNNTPGQQPGQQAFHSGGQGSEGRARGETNSSTRMADERLVQQTEVQSSDARGARPGQLYL
ncbi:flagellar hook-length control protein FliK [Rhizobium wuzhouense]|nr:flagellar hook-length control protein FliK [Rhizobium wuzhouense]